MSERIDFGVLYGQKTTEDALLIYSSYEDAKASPSTGDFIVLTPKDEDGRKFLARVEAEIYDEDPIFRSQDKTLIAVHYARIAERELSDRDKQKMFSYTYKVKLLGTFIDKGTKIEFTTAVRKLPTVSYIARHLNTREIDQILNRDNQDGVAVGYLCIGDEEPKEKKEILFNINRLRDNRSMVFAQSRFGKTNFVKILIDNMIKDTKYGKLVFDLNGEYIFRGTKTYGFADIDDSQIKSNLVIFTDKEKPPEYKDKSLELHGVKLNLAEDMTINDILQSAIGLTNAGRTFLEYIDSLPDDTIKKKFISNILNEKDHTIIRHFAYEKFSSYFETQNGKEEPKQHLRSMLGGVIRQIKSFSSINEPSSSLSEDVKNALKQGKTVIIDLSLKDNIDANLISGLLVRNLFEHNKKYFTSNTKNKIINTVIFIEEAQNVLSDEFMKSNANYFVRVAKEGRKFGIGMVAITQRPSAISEEIRTQAENFFAFHLGNSDDIKALIKSNVNYEDVIASFIQRETIPGNLYMVSSEQAFALPIRVKWFEELVENKVYESSKFPK
jgi:DNA helicase HerA-like ATPase